MAKSREAPANTYWRDGTLWGRITVKGREIRFSLRTDDAEAAASRVKARREREIAAAHFGDQRLSWEDAVLAWGEHIAASVKPSTAKRYAVSLKQLEPFLLGLYLDEIDKGVVSEIVRQRRAKGATNATIRRDLVALSSVLGYSEERAGGTTTRPSRASAGSRSGMTRLCCLRPTTSPVSSRGLRGSLPG